MASADITIKSGPKSVPMTPGSATQQSASASASASATTSAPSAAASKSSSGSRKNTASSANNDTSRDREPNSIKEIKSNDEATPTQAKGNETTAANTTADTSKDFLTTLATLLDKGATSEPQVAAKPVNTAALNEAPKAEEAPADTQAAMIEAMLFGAQWQPTTPTAMSAPAQTSGDNTAAVNVSRSLASAVQSVLNSNTIESGVISTAAIVPNLDGSLVDHLTESRDENTDAVDNTLTANSALSVANDNRASSEQAVREQGALTAHVGTAKWTDELAARVSLLSQRDIHTASLRLSPEHLGPLEIQITVQNDKTSVWFGAAHAETRAALEQALPRLRELLSTQGLTLTDSGVFREPPRDQMRGYQGQSGSPTSDSPDATRVEIDLRAKVNRSLLDAYA